LQDLTPREPLLHVAPIARSRINAAGPGTLSARLRIRLPRNGWNMRSAWALLAEACEGMRDNVGRPVNFLRRSWELGSRVGVVACNLPHGTSRAVYENDRPCTKEALQPTSQADTKPCTTQGWPISQSAPAYGSAKSGGKPT
jgi:hypothetical protein